MAATVNGQPVATVVLVDPVSGVPYSASPTGSPTLPKDAATAAYANSLIVKATAGMLYGISGYNSGGSQFVQVFDAATLPANGAVPKIMFFVPANSNFSWDGGDASFPFATGIVIAVSTTGPSLTLGAATAWINALYN